MFTTDQAYNVTLRDDSRTPPAADIRGKVREFIGVKSVNNRPAGSTAPTGAAANHLLIGFIPAGRGRVIIEASAMRGTIALGAVNLVARAHKGSLTPVMPGGGPTTGMPTQVPNTTIGTLTSAANATASFVPAAGNEVIGWRFNALEDIMLVAECANAVTDAAEVRFRIVFVQE